jgi:preprotein translocase subunit Sec61beta
MAMKENYETKKKEITPTTILYTGAAFAVGPA